MAKRNRIVIKKTTGEWRLIDGNPIIKKSKSINKYILYSVARLTKKYIESPDCIELSVGKRKRREFYVSEDIYNTLELMAKLMNRPICDIVDDLFLVPLLRPE